MSSAPSDLVAIGEEVEVRIAKIDRRKKRIDLSMIGLVVEVEEDGDQPAMQTSMEMALSRARDQKPGSSRRRPKNRSLQIAEREAILARTLRDHRQRD